MIITSWSYYDDYDDGGDNDDSDYNDNSDYNDDSDIDNDNDGDNDSIMNQFDTLFHWNCWW